MLSAAYLQYSAAENYCYGSICHLYLLAPHSLITYLSLSPQKLENNLCPLPFLCPTPQAKEASMSSCSQSSSILSLLLTSARFLSCCKLFLSLLSTDYCLFLFWCLPIFQPLSSISRPQINLSSQWHRPPRVYHIHSLITPTREKKGCHTVQHCVIPLCLSLSLSPAVPFITFIQFSS